MDKAYIKETSLWSLRTLRNNWSLMVSGCCHNRISNSEGKAILDSILLTMRTLRMRFKTSCSWLSSNANSKWTTIPGCQSHTTRVQASKTLNRKSLMKPLNWTECLKSSAGIRVTIFFRRNTMRNTKTTSRTLHQCQISKTTQAPWGEYLGHLGVNSSNSSSKIRTCLWTRVAIRNLSTRDSYLI